jgi:hypothetical protein
VDSQMMSVRAFFLYHHLVGFFPRFHPLEWAPSGILSCIPAHPFLDGGRGGCQQAVGACPRHCGLYRFHHHFLSPAERRKPGCAFLEGRWGGPVLRSPHGIPLRLATPLPHPTILREHHHSFTPLLPRAARTDSPQAPSNLQPLQVQLVRFRIGAYSIRFFSFFSFFISFF